jgi:membrane associated rhomboid family serine protease
MKCFARLARPRALRSRPRKKTMLQRRLHSNHMRTRLGSTAIFCVITAMFIFELGTGAVGNDARLIGLGALPDSGQIHHEYWRLITFGFLHGTLTHVLLNTVLLLWVGPVVERRAGTAWLLLIFLSASVASGVGILVKHQLWPSQGASVGASGGLFGLLGAALVLVFRLPSQSPFVRIGLVVVLVVGLTYSVFPGISMAGHIIGLIVGIAITLLIPLDAATPSVPGA